MTARVLAIVVAMVGVAHADIGSVSPGPLARAHAAFEAQCDRCHVPFGGVPAERCLSCHTQLAQQVARGTGFHATPSVRQQECTACHGDHHGRDAALSPPPPSPFDHGVATFPLEGQHAQLACARCHPADRWVGIATACARCHPDTAHKGSLGSDCAACHRAQSWTPATRTVADHKVSLAGGHAALKCADCHRSGLHMVARQACSQCHAPAHGGTKRECETCHVVAGWKQVSFVHSFPPERLPGKHQTAACLACHPKFKFAPTSFECAACHDKERPHKPLGACEQCHSPLTWETRTFDHDRPEIGFPLVGRHVGLECKACHPDGNKFAPVKPACDACHANIHGERYTGRDCAGCHTANDWKPSTIAVADHDKLGYPLRASHARAACTACHDTRNLASTPTACASCHRDVRHRGALGLRCERCHDDTTWSHTPAFDHETTGFPLERGHANVTCNRCHGENGMLLVGNPAPKACETCHATPHGTQFGKGCTQCHNTASWRDVAPFDHDATGFPLERRHQTLACAACHNPKQQPVVSRECRTCHGDPHRGGNGFACEDCHRADRWRVIRFDHDLTDYPLTGSHRITRCNGCHTNPTWTGVRTDCVSCHALDRPRDRLHLTTVTCDDCHNTTSWKSLHRR